MFLTEEIISSRTIRYRSESKIKDLTSEMIHKKDSIPQSTFYDQFTKYMELQKGRENMMQVRMVCPGKICQLYRTSVKLSNVPCSSIIKCLKCATAACGLAGTQKYTVLWTEAEDLSDICISTSMMVDHFPYNVSRALQVAAESVNVFDIRTDELSTHEIMQEGEKKRS